jgi:hypothetical protein
MTQRQCRQVQYPGLATAVAADLLTLRALAAAALALSSPGAVPDLAWLVGQLRRNLVRLPVAHVSVLRVLPQRATQLS